MEKQLSKPQWIEDFKKMSNLFKAEENSLIQTFLQEDYSLLSSDIPYAHEELRKPQD